MSPAPATAGPAFVPGEMYFLRARSRPLPEDSRDHLHMLATDASSGAGPFGTLVYASSSRAELEAHAEYHAVAPTFGPDANGLRDETYFYGSILVRLEYDEIGKRYAPKYHRVGGALADVRDCVRRGLGLGSGPYWNHKREHGEPASWRGKVVELKRAAADELGTQYAVVLTSHRYSAREQFQAVAPLVVADEVDVVGPASQITRVERPWVAPLLRSNGQSGTALLTAAPLVRALRHDRHIARATGRTMDDDLPALERQIEAYLQL